MKFSKIIFLIIGSLLILGWLFSTFGIKGKAIRMTLCGGDGIEQVFEHFSADYKDNHRENYSGSAHPSILVFNLKDETGFDGHRFDFGSIPGKIFMIKEIAYEKPGFQKYVLDLSKAKQWVKGIADIKPPRYLDGGLLVETTGKDGRLFTGEQMIERFSHAEINYSLRNILIALGLELLLVLAVFAGPVLVRKTSRAFMIQSAIFILANLLLIILPAYFYCRTLPDVFSISMKPEKSFNFAIFCKPSHVSESLISVPCSGENKFDTLNIPLKKDAVENQIRLDFGELSQTISIRDISIIKYGLFRHQVNLQKFQEIYPRRNQIEKIDYKDGLLSFNTTGIDPYVIPSGAEFDFNTSFRLVFGGIFRCILTAEIILLLLLSQSFRDLILKISPVKLSDKENLKLSLSVAGAFTFILVLSLPLQTYKMAEEIILFNIGMLVDLLCWLVPAVFIGLAAILFFLNKRYGAIFTVLLASVTVLFAVESGWLSFSLPELNGDFDAYFNVPRMIFHIAVWLIGLILPLCFQKKIYHWIPLALLAVCVMNGAALTDALLRKNPFQGRGKLIVKSTVNFDGTIEKVKYAVKNNVIMICLDAVTTEAVYEAFKNYPELKKQYQGFIFFTNHAGMNVSTMWAVPGFFTGKIPDDETDSAKYTSGMYSQDSALKNYINRHFAIFFRVGLPRLSYIYPDDENEKRKVNLLTPVEDSMLQWVFHELFLFKITPFFLKGKLMQHYFYTVWPNRQKNILADDSAFTSYKRDENYIYKKLAEAPLLDAKFPGSFHYHHFHGAHQPYKFDKDGNPVDRSSISWQTDWKGYYERVVFELKRVANYFNVLKKRGLYDDSVIIVCADHGLEPTLDKNYTLPRYHPLLMIKCRNSKAALSLCSLPTSHTKIAPFLKSDDIFAIKQDSLPSLFYTEIRHAALAAQKQFSLDQNFKIISEKKLSAKSAPLQNIILGFEYSFYHVGNNRFPPVEISNLTRAIQGIYLERKVVGSLKFKVSDKSASYNIKMKAAIYHSNRKENTADVWTPSSPKQRFTQGGANITLQSVKPDENGIITINVQGGNLYLMSLLVTKETAK